MINTCDCSVILGNTGTPTCEEIAKVAKGIIIVPTFKEDGTFNELDLLVPITPTIINDLINQASKQQRWYPFPELENVINLREDPIFETSDAGINFFVQEGPKSFLGMLFGQGPVLLGKLQQANCGKNSAYLIDKGDSLIGIQVGTKLRPIRIQDNTFYPKLVDATDSTLQKVSISFNWDNTVNDADLRMILPVESGDVSWLELEGLLDVNSSYSGITTTEFLAALTLDYGTAITKDPVVGLVAGDFALFNVTDTLAVTILTAVESPDGSYLITYALQASADVLRLTPTLDGFDFSAVVANTITIP